MVRAIILPGNGCSGPSIRTSNFYGTLATSLEKSNLFSTVIASPLPDPNRARRSIWLPHIKDVIGVDEETVIIGHSSGAEATLRLIETEKVLGVVLVSACNTDLGDAGERESGWYPPSGGPWQWQNMKQNTQWIIQFHSTDDPFIDISEARHVHKMLGGDSENNQYYEFKDRSHFFDTSDSDVIFEKIVDKVVGMVEPAPACGTQDSDDDVRSVESS